MSFPARRCPAVEAAQGGLHPESPITCRLEERLAMQNTIMMSPCGNGKTAPCIQGGLKQGTAHVGD